MTGLRSVALRAAAEVPGLPGEGLDYAAVAVLPGEKSQISRARTRKRRARNQSARARHPQACNYSHFFWPNERPANQPSDIFSKLDELTEGSSRWT
jgi:hypothetical protein